MNSEILWNDNKKIQLTDSSLTTVSIFLKVGSVSMLTTIISSGIVKNINNQSLIYAIISHPSRENDGEKNAFVV